MKLPAISRFTIVGAILALMAALIPVQMVRIQTNVEARDKSDWFDQNFGYEERTLTPERGNIYDRWGNLLAGNREVYEIGVALNEVESPETIARDLAAVLGADYAGVLSAASTKYVKDEIEYIALVDFVDADSVAKLAELQKQYSDLPPARRGQENPSLLGLHWTAHLHRSYPENELGSNVIGFVPYLDRSNNSGLYGVEQYYDTMMAGAPLDVVIAVNPANVQEIPNVQPGDSLILTIDREIQSKMEIIIDAAVADTGSDSGTIIVMNPETGEILAMATTPRLNINEYWNYGEIFTGTTPFNRAISQTLEPGSTFKVITMASALDSGVITPSNTYYDDGWEEVGGINIHNWDYTIWNDQDMTGCMRHSINTCLVWVAKQMGPTLFYDYLLRFGIGHRTNVDLYGEQTWPLSLPGDPDWYQVNLGTNAYGQGLAVTPIQLITAISAVANDGTMMAPHILRAYIRNGRQYNVEPMPIGSPISAETAHTLSEMLAISLEEEASKALVEGYRISGKTGTADIPEGDGWSDYTNASFIGWGPTDDPKFIVYVWLEKPKSDRWGSVLAAPVFQQAVEQLVVLMDLPPDTVRLQLK